MHYIQQKVLVNLFIPNTLVKFTKNCEKIVSLNLSAIEKHLSIDLSKSVLTRIRRELWDEKEVEVYIKRDDLIHPVISGNKWRKLKYYIEEYFTNGYDAILTFGGSYSNHLDAYAEVCNQLNIQGYYGMQRVPQDKHSTLKRAEAKGIEILKIEKKLWNESQDFWSKQFNKKMLVIPMGGSGRLGQKGCGEIIESLPDWYTVICVGVGSGTTLRGLLTEEFQKNIMGFYPHPKIDELNKRLLIKHPNLLLFGHPTKFGKISSDLIEFGRDFYLSHHIVLDPIYTLKMMNTIDQKIAADNFEKESKIICIHSGGLQGWQGMQEQNQISFEDLDFFKMKN